MNFDSIPLAEKVAQLFLVAHYGDEETLRRDETALSFHEATDKINQLVQANRVGGVLFKGMWTPTGLRERIRELSHIADIPLLFAQDLEWGLAMRHYGVLELPKALTMGAIGDDSLVEQWGTAIAQSAKSVGINLVLGPVSDVYSNPCNPVIHDRSFGSRPHKVATNVDIVVRAIQKEGIAACCKHFPGHGNTSADSHLFLPSVSSDRASLSATELVPFAVGIDAKVATIMTAHVAFPATKSGLLPASLSEYWCKKVLREDLGFEGVCVSDDLIMGGALSGTTIEEAAIRAIRAGNDMCILSKNVNACFEAVINAVRTVELYEKELDKHVERILILKSRFLPQEFVEPTDMPNLFLLQKTLYKKALTLIGEPFVFNPNIALILPIGSAPLCLLGQKILKHYPDAFITPLSHKPSRDEMNGVLHSMQEKKEIIVILGTLSKTAHNFFGITPNLINGLQDLADAEITLRYVIFGSPYVLDLLPQPIASALIAYEMVPASEKAAFKALQGSFLPTGQLPIDQGEEYF